MTKGSPKDKTPILTNKCLILYIYIVYIYFSLIIFYLHMSFFFRNFAADLKRLPVMERELTLHEAKMDLLRIVDRMKTVDEVQAVRQVLANYYALKVDEEMERLWDNGTINEQILEQWSHEHMRTPYRYAE